MTVGAALLRPERLKRIQRLVEDERSVRASDLATRLGVSRETVRRDLAALEQAGHVVRSHGGAVKDGDGLLERSHGTRSALEAPAKRRIGERAAGLVADGQAVAFDCSTTTLELVRRLAGRPITAITNGVHVATALGGHEPTRVIVTGGILHHGNMSLIGPEAVAAARRFLPDLAFVSAPAVSPRGVMDANPFEVAVKQALVHGAREVIVLADHTKFGRRAFEVVVEWGEVDALITDEPPEPALTALLAAEGVEVVVAREQGAGAPEGKQAKGES